MLPNACPKPLPKVKPPRGIAKKNKARAAEEFTRTFGSRARQKWVRLQNCAACNAWGFSENAHVLGNDGASRRGSYKGIAPLCGVRPWKVEGISAIYEGCHTLSHRDPAEFRARYPEFSAKKAAAMTERNWRKFLASSSGDHA
jgi:hypothetical protein